MHAYLAPNLHSLAKGGSSSGQYHELLRKASVLETIDAHNDTQSQRSEPIAAQG
jgi:hypothetical protein